VNKKLSVGRPSRFNPALIAVVALPAFAIVASLGTVAVAVMSGDRPLPEQYHWEGFKLDRDFERSAQASKRDVHGTLKVSGADSTCRLSLSLDGPLPPELELALIHGTLPALDQRVRLVLDDAAIYEARCEVRPDGSWRIELSDPDGIWSVRQHVNGSLAHVEIAARPTTSSSLPPT